MNYLRYPQQFTMFRRWRSLLKLEKEMLDSMPRSDLIKLLQRQKDKI